MIERRTTDDRKDSPGRDHRRRARAALPHPAVPRLGLPDGADPSVVFATKTAIEWEDWAAALDVLRVALREGHAQTGS